MSDALEPIREAAREVWPWVRRTPWLAAVPSLLFAGGTALDLYVAPLHSLLVVVVGAVRGVAWGLYFAVALRRSGGVAHGSPVVPVVMMLLGFLGVSYGNFGLLVFVLAWLLPLSDFAVMYAEGPDGALAGVLETLKSHALPWFTSMFAVLVALVMAGLALALPMNLYATSLNRESAWLADLTGGLLVGPLVHAAVVFRARLFLALHGDPA